MSMFYTASYESINPVNIIKTIRHRARFRKENPYYFWADGLIIYCGPQGSGKTLSAVNYIYKMMTYFPKAKLVTNLYLQQYPFVTYREFMYRLYEHMEMPDNIRDFQKWFSTMSIEDDEYYRKVYLEENRVFYFENNDDFMKYNNGMNGVIFFVDEIQLYLNSLESKNINMEVITEISQQRKQRKHIVCTSQVFGRMAKPLREQFSNVICCKSYMAGLLQINKLIDRDSIDSEESTGTNLTGKVKRMFVWFHNPFMYGRYDTYTKIEKNKFIAGEERKGDIYGSDFNFKLSGRD